MKIKTLLLGSAAALVAAGGAQAADLSIAEPVEYVRVCDAFGVGYWYIPGTDTCIKIGGSVEFMVKFAKTPWVFGSSDVLTWSYTFTTTGPVVSEIGYSATPAHSSHWKFVTEAKVNFTAKSMTEYGALVGYVQLVGVVDPLQDAVKVDEAYLQLGHVLMGYTGSVQNTDEGFAPGAWRPDTSTNQIQLQWAAAGFGLYLGIEDPRKRWGTELTDDDEHYTAPDITGRVTISGGHWDARLTAGVGWIEEEFGPDHEMVYGIAGTVTAGIDAIGTGSKIRVGASYGTGDTFVGAGSTIFDNHDTNWTAFISALWQATPTVGFAGTFAYAENTTDQTSETAGGAKLVWKPVAGFEAYAEGKAWKTDSQTEHDWSATLGFKRSW